MLALLTHQFPELMGVFAKAVSVHWEGALGNGLVGRESQGRGQREGAAFRGGARPRDVWKASESTVQVLV